MTDGYNVACELVLLYSQTGDPVRTKTLRKDAVVEQITLHKYLDCVHTGEFGEGR
jgi:hypothetical protein